MTDDEALNRTCVDGCPNGLHGWWCRFNFCTHQSRRQVKAPEIKVTERGPMQTRFWDCPECFDQWTTTRKVRDDYNTPET